VPRGSLGFLASDSPDFTLPFPSLPHLSGSELNTAKGNETEKTKTKQAAKQIKTVFDIQRYMVPFSATGMKQ